MKLLGILLLCFFLSFCAEAQEKLITQAIEVLEELQESLDQPLFTFILQRAEGILIFPEVKRIGLVVGGYFGNGFLLREDEKGRFFGPAFFRIEGVSIGPQIGIQSQGLVLLVMNRAGIESFCQDGVILGGNISVTAGPVGRGISAGVDLELSSGIYSYAISRGLFVGISLEGARIRENQRVNERFFGRRITSREILTQKMVEDPATFKLLRIIKRIRLGKGEET